LLNILTLPVFAHLWDFSFLPEFSRFLRNSNLARNVRIFRLETMKHKTPEAEANQTPALKEKMKQ